MSAGWKQVTMSIERRARVMPTASRRSPPGWPSAPKFAEHAAVRGAAVADREDDAVAALRDALLERGDHERLAAVAEDEVGQVAAWPENARSTACCTRTACLALAVMTMSDSRGRVRACSSDERDDAVDLGVDALDGAGTRGRALPWPPET